MPGSTSQPPRWSAVLMAGGASRRMGRDKALLELDGEPLWRRQWRVVHEAGAGEVMIARGEQAWVEIEGIRRIPDAAPDCGPLGGVVSALRLMRGAWLLVLAVDLPQMTAGCLRRLGEASERLGSGVVPMLEGHFEPLAAIYPRACLLLAEEALAARTLPMQALMSRCVEAGLLRTLEVPEEEKGCFHNANRPEDLR